jgi:hypothetical protein
MSILAVNKFTLALEHEGGLIEDYRAHPDEVLGRYRLTQGEREEIRRLDAQALLDRGVNPIVIRNLLVILGIKHGEMYRHGGDA